MPAHLRHLCTLAVISATMALAQQPAVPQTNSSHIDPDGTAHVTRIVPVPGTISPEAQKVLARPASDAPTHDTLAQRRAGTDTWQNRAGQTSAGIFPVHIQEHTIAGVPVRDITPVDSTPPHPDHVHIKLQGGGFHSDSGSLTESIPIANLTHTRVVAILYRLAPEHPYPAGLDDAIAVYRELLKTYKPLHIAIYGTSAGAILTAEVAVRLKQLHLPEPAALGIFSGLGDFANLGDSQAMYALNGLSGHLDPPSNKPADTEYIGQTDPHDPVLSPIFADLHGLPPTLFLTSGRDLLLSGTTLLHRAFLRHNVDAHLIVFEALPHAFWNDVSLPESHEAYGYMADFFSKHLNR